MGHLSLISEHLPLGNTKPVLLVRDDERKVVINDLLLDQGVGAYDHVCLMGGNFPIGDAFFLCRHGSGDKNHIFINTMLFKKFCHRFEMLPRKDFRRNHKGSLISILTDGQKRQYRYDRLTGANIPLDQPVHDRTASEVFQHLLQRPHLGICELIRQLIQKSSAFVLLFYKEKLIIYEAFSGKCQIFLIRREMDMFDRKIIFRKLICDPETCRQIIPFQSADRKGLFHRRGDRLIPKSLRLGIYGPQAG